jgi:signal transduction histidine kinase
VEALARAEALHVESERVTADGERRDFLLHVAPPESGEGNPLGYVIYTDITDRKRRERQLNSLHATTRELMTAGDREAVCEAVVEAASDVLGLPVSGVHLLTDDGEGLAPVAASSGARELFDVEPPTYTRGDDVWSLYEADDPLTVDEIEPEYLDPDAPIDRAMIVPLGDHGVFISSAADGEAFGDGTRELARLLAANTEVALDRMERERELARQNERLDEFASVVSHDLRNPLNVARGFTEIARETGEADAFDRVEAAHDRMDALIEGLLALAREGAVVGDDEPVWLADAAERAWASVHAPDAELSVGSQGAIRADPDRLVQLLENLFRNAADHTDGRVVIGVGTLRGAGEDGGDPDRERAPAGFYVEDDGPGIPEDARDAVLEAGYSTTDGGTGLGLAIVKRIAEAHGWSVTVTESDAGGARFEFRC